MNNQVIYHTKLHWIIFAGPLLLLIGALILQQWLPQIGYVPLFFAGFALLWLGMTWVTYHFSSLIIKNKQVILRTGMLVRKTVDIPLSKIESIDISQTIIGSLLGYGSLVITGTGGTRHFIHQLSNPLTCRRYIEQLMHA